MACAACQSKSQSPLGGRIGTGTPWQVIVGPDGVVDTTNTSRDFARRCLGDAVFVRHAILFASALNRRVQVCVSMGFGVLVSYGHG